MLKSINNTRFARGAAASSDDLNRNLENIEADLRNLSDQITRVAELATNISSFLAQWPASQFAAKLNRWLEVVAANHYPVLPAYAPPDVTLDGDCTVNSQYGQVTPTIASLSYNLITTYTAQQRAILPSDTKILYWDSTMSGSEPDHSDASTLGVMEILDNADIEPAFTGAGALAWMRNIQTSASLSPLTVALYVQLSALTIHEANQLILHALPGYQLNEAYIQDATGSWTAIQTWTNSGLTDISTSNPVYDCQAIRLLFPNTRVAGIWLKFSARPSVAGATVYFGFSKFELLYALYNTTGTLHIDLATPYSNYGWSSLAFDTVNYMAIASLPSNITTEINGTDAYIHMSQATGVIPYVESIDFAVS